MLTICESFASSCGLCFNPLKTQLIRFHLFDKGSVIDKFIFCGLVLQVVTSVIHLGNKLTYAGGLRFDVESRRSETEQMLYTIATA